MHTAEEISAYEARIRDARERAQYADGPSFREEMAKVSGMQAKLNQMKREVAEHEAQG